MDWENHVRLKQKIASASYQGTLILKLWLDRKWRRIFCSPRNIHRFFSLPLISICLAYATFCLFQNCEAS